MLKKLFMNLNISDFICLYNNFLIYPDPQIHSNETKRQEIQIF